MPRTAAWTREGPKCLGPSPAARGLHLGFQMRPNQRSLGRCKMRLSRIVVFSLLFPCLVAAEAAPQIMREMYSSRDSVGRERVYRVPESQLLATKKWLPESEPPPLSITAAVAAAVKSVNAKGAAGVRVIQIDLIPTGGQNDWRWFYRIELVGNSVSKRYEVLEVLVLMDGSIIEAGWREKGEAKRRP